MMLNNIGHYRKLPAWWQAFKHDWRYAEKTLIPLHVNPKYWPDPHKWVCACLHFSKSQFLICKHLVQSVSLVPLHFFRSLSLSDTPFLGTQLPHPSQFQSRDRNCSFLPCHILLRILLLPKRPWHFWQWVWGNQFWRNSHWPCNVPWTVDAYNQHSLRLLRWPWISVCIQWWLHASGCWTGRSQTLSFGRKLP